MDVEGFFQSWTLAAALVTSTAAAWVVLWKVVKAGDKLVERTAQRLLDKLDHRQEPIIREVVGDEIQTRLDNGSNLRLAVDAVQVSADANRLAVCELKQAVDENVARTMSVDLRLGNVERQLENVITEEIPQITMLAEHVLKRHEVEGDAG